VPGESSATPSMTVGLARGVKVPLLVWTCIVALDDRYVDSVGSGHQPQPGLQPLEKQYPGRVVAGGTLGNGMYQRQNQ
jgi:hypothetical protein